MRGSHTTGVSNTIGEIAEGACATLPLAIPCSGLPFTYSGTLSASEEQSPSAVFVYSQASISGGMVATNRLNPR